MQEIHLKKEDAQEILNRPPHYLIRCGSLVIALFIAAILIFSYIFHFPDIIQAPILITTVPPPVELKAQTGGGIAHFFVKDRDTVPAHAAIAVLNSTAEWQDILILSRLLDSLPEDSLPQLLCKDLRLGELQNTYNQFVIACQLYRKQRIQHFDKNKKNLLLKEIGIQRKIRSYACNQLQYNQQCVEIQTRLYQADSLLYRQQHLSLIAYEESRSQHVNRLQSLENQKQLIADIDLQITHLQGELLAIEKQMSEETGNRLLDFQNAKESLKAEIKKWRQNYLFESPIKGIVSLTEYAQAHQYIKEGHTLATILPTQEIHVQGKIALPAHGAGKVRQGQQAFVRLDQFPYQEYGRIPVVIQKMSLTPVNSEQGRHYLLEVNLPFPLQTDYGIFIPYLQEMEGNIEIITKDKRLIEKMFQPIQQLFHHNLKKYQEHTSPEKALLR